MLSGEGEGRRHGQLCVAALLRGNAALPLCELGKYKGLELLVAASLYRYTELSKFAAVRYSHT